MNGWWRGVGVGGGAHVRSLAALAMHLFTLIASLSESYLS